MPIPEPTTIALDPQLVHADRPDFQAMPTSRSTR